MNRTHQSNRLDARRTILRLRDGIAEQLPSKLVEQFDQGTESASLGALSLVVFIHRHLRQLSPAERNVLRDWLEASADPSVCGLLDWAFGFVDSQACSTQLASLDRWCQASETDVVERLSAMLDPVGRKRHGFYCTPRPLAEFIVCRVHRALIRHFRLPDGILSPTFPTIGQTLNILEPAVGTGVFLSALVRIAWRQFQVIQRRKPCGTTWSDCVSHNLLTRIFACDIQLGPLACAHVRMATSLHRSGYSFAAPVELQMRRLDLLATLNPRNAADDGIAEFQRTPFSLIIGNPPYGAIQGQADESMRKLMHGQFSGLGGDVDYFQSARGPIGERKTWMYDQYIQFLRLAHWRISQAGGGISALLTNRGFLQHVTMRGLRYQWLRTFDRIEIHDFQGGGDRNLHGQRLIGENVFGVRSGIALSVLCKLPRPPSGKPARFKLYVHSGIATEKLRRLRSNSSTSRQIQELSPAPPLFLFQVHSQPKFRSSAFSIPLDKCFVRKSSAIVTARDSLVIGMERDELLERISQLRDQQYSDSELRDLLFAKSRGQKYPRGDTRGWKLAEARAMISADPNWQSYVRLCSYRPLDDRLIYWHPKMIDWRREAISELMLDGRNPGLIARRQLPDDAAANFFWITRWPTIDGIVRSDNRGNEFVFPLWGDAAGTVTNLSPQFIDLATSALHVDFELCPPEKFDSPDAERLTVIDLFSYLAAIVFSESYRDVHQAAMRHDFAQIFITRDEGFFRQLARHGRRLIQMIAWNNQNESQESIIGQGRQPSVIEIPRFDSGRIFVGDTVLIEGLSESNWQFQAGHHQVCRKWLADRRGRQLTPQLRQRFVQVCHAVQKIRSECTAIESTINSFGGWDQIF